MLSLSLSLSLLRARDFSPLRLVVQAAAGVTRSDKLKGYTPEVAHRLFKGVVRANSFRTEHVAAATALALRPRASAQQDPPILLLPPGLGFWVWGLGFSSNASTATCETNSNLDVIDTAEIKAYPPLQHTQLRIVAILARGTRSDIIVCNIYIYI